MGENRAAEAATNRKDIEGKAYSPLALAQERLWFLQNLELDETGYHRPCVIRLVGELDVGRFSRCLKTIIDRHEALRAYFPTYNGMPVQVIAPPGLVNLPLCDLTEAATSNKEDMVAAVIAAEVNRKFDIARGPLYRLLLIRLNPNQHELVCSFHHLVFDGWSAQVLLKELATLYDAEGDAASAKLPRLTTTYTEYARLQRVGLADKAFDEHLAYWRGQLAGEIPVLDLPLDHQRPSRQTFAGRSHTMLIPPEGVSNIRLVCRRERVTPFMVFLTALKALLYKYTEQPDIIIGTPVAGRDNRDTENLIGLFINTLPLRSQLQENLSLRQVLHTVRRVALEAFDHQQVPFEKIVEAVNPPRDMSLHPIFQVMLNMHNMPQADIAGTGLSFEEIDAGHEPAVVDITLKVAEKSDGFHCSFVYNRELFSPATIERMARHYRLVLTYLNEDLNRPLADISLVNATELQLIREWNSNSADFPQDQSLVALFEDQVARAPEATALFYEGERISYLELNAKANQVAHCLRRKGAGPEVRVGICLTRSIEMIAGLLGILKAGAAYVPLDPAYPAERLRFMLADSGTKVLLTKRPLLDSLQLDSEVMTVDISEPPCTEGDFGDPPHLPSHSDLLCVVYTSGSTGTPKGVLESQVAFINRLHWMWREYPFLPSEVCCQKTALSFVDSIWEIFGPLLKGIPAVIIPDQTVRDPDSLVMTLRTHGVTRIVLVPSLLRALLDWGVNQQMLPALTLWTSSGEALPYGIAQRFRQAFSDAVLLNIYGSSEVAADATCYEVRVVPEERSYVPIGRPIANTEVYVLDSHRRIVPIGIKGELYVGGSGVARGYQGRPDLTAERFVRHSFHPGAEVLLFKTGDYGRWLSDGNLELRGRTDGQVKVRGVRVELAEIERILLEHPKIRSAAIIPKITLGDDTVLTAYVSLVPGENISVPGLRNYLGTKLPAPMVPSSVLVLAEFPFTPSGKIDKKALALKEDITNQGQEPIVFVANPVEQKMADVWRQTLGLDNIGLDENFFDLGGHSLLAVRLVLAIEREFGIRLPLSTLIGEGTIKKLSQEIMASSTKSRERTSVVEIQPGGSGRPLFCVHPAGGEILAYHRLVTYLGNERRIYGLQYIWANEGELPVEELARRHVECIKRVQLQGPYRLLGHSMGGTVAFEMARQLRESGDEVAALILLDTKNVHHYSRFGQADDIRRDRKQLTARMKNSFAKFRATSPQGWGEYLWFRLSRELSKLYSHKLSRMWRGKAWKELQAKRELTERLMESNLKFVPMLYCDSMILFRALERRESFRVDEHLGWREVVLGDIDVIPTPGDHGTLIEEPYVKVLGDQLRQILARTDR